MIKRIYCTWGRRRPPLGLSLARSTKLPNAEELFSNGPHLATNAFEIGDPNLEEETSLGADLTLRKVSGRLTGVWAAWHGESHHFDVEFGADFVRAELRDVSLSLRVTF